MLKTNGRILPSLLLAVVAVLLTLLLPMEMAVANPREQKNRIDKRVEELQQEFRDLDDDLARTIAEKEAAEDELPGAEEALAQAQDELEEAQREDEELGARLTSAENAQSGLQDDIDEGEAALEEKQKSVTKIARQAYQNSGVTSDVAMLLQMANKQDGASGATRVDSAVRSQQRSITQLSEQRSLNMNNKDRLDAVTDEISDLKEEAAKVVLRKEAAEADAKQKRDDLDELITTKDAASKRIENSRAETERQLEEQKAEQDRLAKEVEDWEKEQEAKGLPTGNGDLVNPAQGFPVTSPFGYRIHPISRTRKLHTGTDFGMPCGSQVRAAGDGVVVSAGWAGGYGNRVVISHGKMKGANIASTYNHNSSLKVSSGTRVKQGQIIASSGTTGASTGCHLHFEIMQNGSYVNPMPWIS
ncbi:peptidoglycan DD-metalloendopeptidase family protein [Brevibacterium otitidis]|uniref:Peptidoglycan DD-metalloendopeptidase family protein n=1 Tax=Brevibacterium otitidis TaxID=53364 RepID=A0ABV5X2V5_9MICO|nr:M23 family metallopeptidase [Brevibacterium otitidis]